MQRRDSLLTIYYYIEQRYIQVQDLLNSGLPLIMFVAYIFMSPMSNFMPTSLMRMWRCPSNSTALPRNSHEPVTSSMHKRKKTMHFHILYNIFYVIATLITLRVRRFTYKKSRWKRLCPWSGSVRFSPRLWIFRSISLLACKSRLPIPICPRLLRELWKH